MQIILVSDRMATARSITLTGRHLFLAVTALIFTVLALATMFSYLTVRHAAEMRLPFLQEALRSLTLEEAAKTRDLVRENLVNMATRLGQMQARLMELDSLGERLAGLAGVRIKDFNAASPIARGGQGGPLVVPERLDEQALQRALDDLSRQVEAKSEALAKLEDRILDERIRKILLPSANPVPEGVRASGFGWRRDPFTGQMALHEGIDFTAPAGAPILAAAPGIVVNVERHPEYGNVVEIDHGDDLITRYAHASAVLVKPGEFVRRGQQIAAVGATGRATGAHLHFEVRLKGVPQNPERFLAKDAAKLARR